MTFSMNFTGEEYLWIAFRTKHIAVDSNAPEEIKHSIIAKAGRYGINVRQSEPDQPFVSCAEELAARGIPDFLKAEGEAE